MAQADLLVNLIKSARQGNQMIVRKLAEDLIQEERSKGHRILADRLTKAMEATPNGSHTILQKENNNQNNHKDLVTELTPERSLASLTFPLKIQQQVKELVEEQHRSELLHSYNLPARHKLLLAGKPGNGKTTLAEALAHELMYPLLTVRYENLIGSYLGETSGRLKYLFDYIKTQRCVLFFDEFETLGKERGDTHETGEIKRVVSSLLLQIDSLPDYVVIVVASNHPELLDKAVWRRFQMRIELPMPTLKQLDVFIEQVGRRCNTNFGYTSGTLAKHIKGASFAEAEEFCISIVRRAVLNKQTHDAKKITKLKLEQWKARLKPTANN